MDRESILRRIMSRAGLNMDQADKAAHSVLLALTDALPHDEAHDMASQLPKEFKDLMMGRMAEGGPVQRLNWGAFVSRIQTALDLETEEGAARVIKAVFSALKDAVSPGEIEDVLPELSLDLREVMRTA